MEPFWPQRYSRRSSSPFENASPPSSTFSVAYRVTARMTGKSAIGVPAGHHGLMTSAGRGARVATVVGTGAVAAAALTYIGLADPHRPGFGFPPCPFKAVTGWNCPLCGGLRMTHDVLHGDLAAAVVDNVFALVGLPLLVAWLVVCWRRRLSVTPPLVTALVAMVVWTVVRNLPGFPLVPTFT